MRTAKALSRYLRPPLSSSRLDRQWRWITSRLGAKTHLAALQGPGDIVRGVRARDGCFGRLPNGTHAALTRKRCSVD
jgi:hypothetical protein